MMKRFPRSTFESASAAELAVLCAELASELSQRLRSGADFHASVRAAITELRQQDHQLWLFSEARAEEGGRVYEKWCAEWTEPEAPAGELSITFTAPENVEVSWRTAAGERVTARAGVA